MDDSPSQRSRSIRNFHQVTPWLFRGGQPGAEGFQHLQDIGVKTVICLRWGKKLIDTEKAAVESLGMEFISIPLSYWHLPTFAIIEDFLLLLDNQEKRPFFVHCLHGADRTGLFMAIFRIAKEGWRVEDAYKEMKQNGFHRFRIRNFKWMLWKYARHSQNKEAARQSIENDLSRIEVITSGTMKALKVEKRSVWLSFKSWLKRF